MKKSSFISLLPLACMALMSTAFAGVTAERTRVIFPQDKREVSLMLANLNTYPVITQVWVNDGQPGNTPESAKAPVMPLPPVFHMDPQQTQTLRLLQLGDKLPSDRESLYWQNIHDVTPTQQGPEGEDSTQVTVTMQTQMKLILRPQKLPQSLERTAASLQFRMDGDRITVTNEGPHYISLAYLQIDAGLAPFDLEDGTLAPFSTNELRLPQPGSGAQPVRVRYGWIDDDGVVHDASRSLVGSEQVR